MSDFQTVAKSAEISAGSMRSIYLDGREVAVANVDGAYYAFDSRCTCIGRFAGHVQDEASDGHSHVGDSGNLVDGELIGDRVTCPMHFTIFDVKSGRPVEGPGDIPVNTYEVRVDRGVVQVAVMSDARRHFWNDPGNKERP